MTNDTAQLLDEVPGVNFQTGGGVSGLPMIRGLADDRVRILVNGATVSPACANHMNPPLSYINPARVALVNVFSGITPVSMGGDSLGGTISVESSLPEFAGPNEKVHLAAQLSSFFRSNETGYGGSVLTSVGIRNFSLGYSGAWNKAGDYTDGNGNKVTSTYYKTNDQSITAAAQGGGNTIVFQAGFHRIPYQGFVNQQMDMTGNRSEFLNLHYEGVFNWGVVDTRVYWDQVRHEMNIGKDKSGFPMPMFMPMNTHGRDLGYSLKTEIPFFEQHTFRLGNEYHHFGLDDSWPPVAGTEPWMAPDSFISINDGHRDRLAFYAELETRWNPKWTTILGIRNDTVWSNAGPVHGYSDMYATDAARFNGQNHSRTDVNYDITALVRYEPNRNSTYEGGYARKTRSPNLYERYAWSTNMMTSGMINWFGDGNYYVGNLDLKPEVAHTVSATENWHDSARKAWDVNITPYFSYVEDYIDVDLLQSVTYGESTFSQLRFANHDAILYGLDLGWDVGLWDNKGFGSGRLKGTFGWVQGKRLDQGGSLYHMMPLNARVSLEETLLKTWKSACEIQAVNKKSEVDSLRHEPETPGYLLVNLRSGYQWGHVALDVGVLNLFDKHYYLPLGGVNFDDFLKSGWSGRIQPLAGQGRSFYAALTMQI
ncbi:MAG TPA: TonB-dependent receptor [Geobacteraceae bacterium]|nr:TonB-dependent receptor [Geobacteraceae bacterium]